MLAVEEHAARHLVEPQGERFRHAVCRAALPGQNDATVLIGLTAEAGGRASRLNHALAGVVMGRVARGGAVGRASALRLGGLVKAGQALGNEVGRSAEHIPWQSAHINRGIHALQPVPFGTTRLLIP